MKRPNILFVQSDQHRFDFVGCRGLVPVRTPNIDALCTQGVYFTQAYSPSPVCAPARACVASGKDYDHCGVPSNNHNYPLNQPTYYRALRDAGYHVAGAGKFDLNKAEHDWGLNGTRHIKEWGFSEAINSEGKWATVISSTRAMPYGAHNSTTMRHGIHNERREGEFVLQETIPPIKPTGPYMNYLAQQGLAEIHIRDYWNRLPYETTAPTPLPDEAYSDNWIAANAMRFLKGFPSDRPWHLFVAFAGPHDPMDVTAKMQESWKEVDFPPPNGNTQFTPQFHTEIRRNYAAIIENIDRHLGQFIDVVRARGELDNTIIVYASDHGEMLGDHDLWGKNQYYQPSVGIPLVVAGTGIAQGVECHAPVALHDLAPTFLEYAGAAPLSEMDAVSLKPVLEGKRASTRDVVTSGLRKWRMICDGRYKLVLEPSKPTVLFDLETDPLENTNIAAAMPDHVERLRNLMESTSIRAYRNA